MITDKANMLCILEVLKEYSDEAHIMTMKELREKLEIEYGIKPDRREWDWREIEKYPGTCTYKFNKEMGIELVWLEN